MISKDRGNERCVIGDSTCAKMTVGSSLLIINAVVKRFSNGEEHIEIGPNTRVTGSCNVEVPDEVRVKGEELNQSAEFIPVANVAKSPLKKMVPLRGRVVSVSLCTYGK